MPSNSSQTRLPLPWLNSPIPKSFIQPSICATLQKTRVKDSIIPPSYPYIVDANGIHPHFEWRGNGAPPRDVGYPGDIYVDLAAPDYALWARGKSGWTKWTTSSHKADLIAHPHLSDRYLWCSVKNPVWCSISAIKLDRNRRPSLSVVEAIQQVLHNEEEEEAKKGKRSRDQRDSHGSEGADEVSDSDEGSTIRVVPRRGKRGRFVSSASTAGPSHTTSLSVALEESSVSVSADEQNSIATKKYEDLTIAEVRLLADAGRPANIAKAGNSYDSLIYHLTSLVSVALRSRDQSMCDLTVKNQQLRETLAKYKGALEIANEARDEATRRAEIADGKLHAIASTLTSKSPPQEKDRWGRQ